MTSNLLNSLGMGGLDIGIVLLILIVLILVLFILLFFHHVKTDTASQTI